MAHTDDNMRDNAFLFSFKRVPEAEKDLDLQIQALDNHISNIINKVEINGVPIVGHVLSVTRKEEELLRIARALEKAAPLITKRENLAARKSVFRLVETDPHWLRWAFADLSPEVEDILRHFESGDDT